jgi:hypothetical protein
MKSIIRILNIFIVSIFFIGCKLTTIQQIKKHNKLNFREDYTIVVPSLKFSDVEIKNICLKIKNHMAVNSYSHDNTILLNVKRNFLTFKKDTLIMNNDLKIILNRNYEDSIQYYVGDKKKQAQFYEYELIISGLSYNKGTGFEKYHIRNGNIIKYNELYYMIIIDKENFMIALNFYNKHKAYVNISSNDCDFYLSDMIAIGVAILLMPEQLSDDCFCDEPIK